MPAMLLLAKRTVGGVTRGTIFMQSAHAHRYLLRLPSRLDLTNSEILRSTSRAIRKWGLILAMENPVVSDRVWKFQKASK